MPTTLLHFDEIDRILDRLASQIIEKHGACGDVLLLGIQRRGADLAARLCTLLQSKLNHPFTRCILDINLYRDDWTSPHGSPVLGVSSIPSDLTGKTAILVDDVLFTGRTVRAALEAILDYGRPARVELLVLIDRGHRELPIHADYVGRVINTAKSEQVNVYLHERDGRDSVEQE